METKSYKKAAATLIKNKSGKILFLKRKKNGLWTIPGGKLEDGEDFLDGAHRELREETGISGIELDFFSHTISFSNEIYWKEATFIGEIEDNHNVTITEEHIFSEVKFFHIDEIEKYEDFEHYDHIILDMLKGKKQRYFSFDEIEK